MYSQCEEEYFDATKHGLLQSATAATKTFMKYELRQRESTVQLPEEVPPSMIKQNFSNNRLPYDRCGILNKNRMQWIIFK